MRALEEGAPASREGARGIVAFRISGLFPCFRSKCNFGQESSEISDARLSVEALLMLVELCHQAVEDPGRLSALAEEISRTLEGAFVSIAECGAGLEGQWLLHTSATEPEHRLTWEKHFAPEGRWRDTIGGLVEGPLLEFSEISGEEEIRRSPFFSGFMEPQGFLPLAGLSCLLRPTETEPGFGWMLLGRREFSPSEVEFCRRLLPHLRLSVRNAGALRTHTELLGVTRRFADQSRAGMVALGEGGRVLWANRAAHATLEKREGLYVHQGQIVAARAEDAQRIRDAIVALTTPGSEPWLVAIERAGKQRPLAVFLVPSGSPPKRGREAIVNAYLIDPDRSFRPSKAVIEHLFQLTDAESRLALAVAEGESAAAIAARTDRSVETVRTQLKFVFRKVGVSRQIELVRVLLNLGLPSRGGD